MPAPTRAELIRDLASSSACGAIGLFLGSGLPRAMVEDAPDFKGLVRRIATEVGQEDPFADPGSIVGMSYPAVVSALTARREEALRAEGQWQGAAREAIRAEAVRQVKLAAARLTAFDANEELRERFRAALGAVNPGWVVTTNYDFMIEELLQPSHALLPEQLLAVRLGSTPVIHVHGHRNHPESIVLLEEDYVSVLADGGYGFQRLSMLLSESTTIMAGYSLGDVNIQTALRLSRTYGPAAPEMQRDDHGRLIFVRRTGDTEPAADPYFGGNGELVVEAAEVIEFFEELATEVAAVQGLWTRTRQAVTQADAAIRGGFVDNQALRQRLLTALREIPDLLSGGDLLDAVLASLAAKRARAYEMNAWEHYEGWLDAVLDVFETWRFGSIPPRLFDYIARELVPLSAIINPDNEQTVGYAWSTTRLWFRRRELFQERPELLVALKSFADRERSVTLRRLLDDV